MYIGVYGSLKKGKYNHPIIDSEPVAKTKIKGVMFRVSSYPVLFEQSEGFEPIEYDLEVYKLDPRTYNAVKGMELGAGYKEKAIKVEGIEEDVFIYVGQPQYFTQSKDLYITEY